MHLPLLSPAFDNRQSLFGLPMEIVLALVAAALLVAALIITIRVTRGDPEPKSFRATTRLEASDLVTRAVLAGLVGVAALTALLLVLRR